MDPRVFGQFRDLIHKTSGISLNDNKVALLTARIGRRMRARGVADPGQYFSLVVEDKGGKELAELLNAISTNVTHFFREAAHFRFLAEQVNGLEPGRTEPLRIWCAACSTGEEPYSIAITVMENLRGAVKVEILASDISTRVLQAAKFAAYRREDVRAIAPPLLKKYFQEGFGKAESFVRAKAALRQMVQFKQVNLSTPPFPIEGRLDLIFCRNVMIYFNEELKRRLAEEFFAKLKPGGHLVLGLAESMAGKSPLFRLVEPSVYVRPQ